MRVVQGIVVLFVLVSNFSFAEPRSVDAGEFDIAGVKLGMRLKDAVAAITAKLDIKKHEIEFEKFLRPNPVTKTKEPYYFIVKKGGASITVHMQPKVPRDIEDPMLVSSVIYEQPWTQENVRAMKNMALEKYGEPSNGVVGSSYQWCGKPHSNPGFGCFEFEGAKLEYSGTKLQLTNFLYQQAVIDFMNKRITSKPMF